PGYAAPRDHTATRGGAPRRARSISAVRVRRRDGAHAVEPVPVDPGAAAAARGGDGLRRAGAAATSVAGTLRITHADDRAAPDDHADAVCADAVGAGHSTRTEDQGDAEYSTTDADDHRCRHRDRGGARRVCLLGATGSPGGAQGWSESAGPERRADAGECQSDVL